MSSTHRAKICCCDLSPSHLCPGLHANAKIANFPIFAKIATLVGDLCSLAFQCSAIFAILTVFAKIANILRKITKIAGH